MSNNEVFNTPNLVKFFKNIIVSNIRNFFQVLKGTLLVKSTIAKQRVSHYLVCFFHMPLNKIEN